MQAANLPATAGWQWARDGLALFSRQPLAMFTWAMAISLALMLASLTPPLGPLLFVVLMPVVTFLTLSACRHVEAGHAMQQPAAWFQPLRNKGVLRRLLWMGVLYAGLCLLAGVVVFVPFMRELAEAMQASSVTSDLTPFLETLRLPMAIFGVIYVVLAALFWYAPALSGFQGVRIGQALFFSGVACWRNKTAFVVYGLVWFAVFLAIDFASGLLVAMGMSAQLAGTLQIPVNVAAGSILYCSFYPSYVTVFGPGAAGFLPPPAR